jgi:hypothetical protein
MRQTRLNTVGPSPVRWSTNWIDRRLALPSSLLSRPLSLDQRHVAQIIAVMPDQVEERNARR